MLDGADFGTAVKYARQRTYLCGGNTWSAYQCYGDPGRVSWTHTGEFDAILRELGATLPGRVIEEFWDAIALIDLSLAGSDRGR